MIGTLTQGLDTIAGNAGNDIINAYAFNGVTGANVTTLNSVDTIDGGAGKDTLNIEVKDDTNSAADFNGVIQGTIKNVEVININNVAATAAVAVDAAKFGAEAQEIWQVGQAGNVSKLASTTTAGFKDIAVLSNTVTAAAAATTASVAFSNVTEGGLLSVDAATGGVLNTVAIFGAIVDGVDAGTTVTALHTHITAGKDIQTVTVNSAVDLAVDVLGNEAGSTKSVTTFNAAGSTGGITYTGSGNAVAIVTTGSGKDDVTVVTATSKTAGSVVNASVTTNAGDDKVTANVTGDGNTTIDTGAGNDTVAITGRGTSVLTVNLGDGADTFTSGVAIAATDTIDAGAGSDTLLLSLVGSSNVVAFKNFDVYDVKGMTASLDLDILNTSNTVTEIVASGALGGAATLQNVAAGVNFRATKDMAFTNVLTLTQKTAGALTVTLDADQATDVAGNDVAQTSVAAAGATSISAVFDAAYAGVAGAGTAGSETAANDNVSTIALATQAAASISVVSGGANAKNVLNVTEGAGTDALTTVTVTGAQALTLSVTGASKLATIDSSAATGGLTAALADLKEGGTIKLGSGTDVITAKGGTTGSNAVAGAESVEGFAKTAAVSVSTASADATAKAAAIAAADKIVIDSDGAGVVNEAVANASISILAATLAKGVLTFTGTGPATLDAALVIADDFAETAGETVAFQYLSNTYLFTQAATHAVGTTAVTDGDFLVKLVGVSGATELAETGTDTFFIV